MGFKNCLLISLYIRPIPLQTCSVTVTTSVHGKSVTVSIYLLTVTLFCNMGFTKIVTVSGVSL